MSDLEYVDSMSKLWPDKSYTRSAKICFELIVDFQVFLNGRFSFLNYIDEKSIEERKVSEIELVPGRSASLKPITEDIMLPLLNELLSVYNNLRKLNSDKPEYFQFSHLYNKLK